MYFYTLTGFLVINISDISCVHNYIANLVKATFGLFHCLIRKAK